MSSLEREVGAKQEAIGQYENQLTEIQAKYEACPKPEMVERYVGVLCMPLMGTLYVHAVMGMYVCEGPHYFTELNGLEWTGTPHYFTDCTIRSFREIVRCCGPFCSVK